MKTTKRQRELVEKQIEEIRLRQGRSKRQVENNNKVLFISVIGLIGCVLYILITAS